MDQSKAANTEAIGKCRQKEREVKEISANLAKANKLIEKYTKDSKACQAAQSQAQTALKKLQEAGFLLKIFFFGKSSCQSSFGLIC